jgi:hypothetical protein
MSRAVVRAVAVTVALLLLATSFVALNAEDLVYFNTNSKKYHCMTCQWAKKCTANCIKISRDEAIKRGGQACKVCGGSC